MTIEEIPSLDNIKQIWKKGNVNKEGYFTLMNKYLTAYLPMTLKHAVWKIERNRRNLQLYIILLFSIHR